jgi:5-amino-6-(5-phospho-D-ribitylamino)uracil phosphatase
MYRMIVTDLDSTLLTTSKRITERARKAMLACREKNMRIVFATARPWRAVQSYLQVIPCDAVIYHNGSTVRSGETILGEPSRISAGRAKEILRKIRINFPDKRLSVEMNDTLYANFPVSYYWSYTDGITTDFVNLPHGYVDKIIVEIDSREDFIQINQFLTEEEYGQICEEKLCLIMNQNASKLNGIHILCQAWNISLDTVITFGDDFNDLEMIYSSGLGVAMANAIPEVLQIADQVTLSNDEDGVAYWLEQFIGGA